MYDVNEKVKENESQCDKISLGPDVENDGTDQPTYLCRQHFPQHLETLPIYPTLTELSIS